MADPAKPATKPQAPTPTVHNESVVPAPPRSRFLQCLTPFPGGTKLPCEGGRMYHFLPNEFGDYVAEVLRDDDYEKILSISAGYQPYWPEKSTKAQKQREQAVEDKATAKATDEQIAADTTTARASLAAAADQERERIARNRDALASAKVKEETATADRLNKAPNKG